MFYYKLNKKDIPHNITAVEFIGRVDAKEQLKEYFNEHSGKSTIDICIYDTIIGDDVTLVEMLSRYIDFEFMNIWVIEPKKVYNFKNTKHNSVFKFSKELSNKIAEHEQTSNIHAIDDITYFFVGYEMDK
jgi:DUF1009 family protein